jgi:hypothetical protein
MDYFFFKRINGKRGNQIMGRQWGRLYAGTRNHRKVKVLREEHPNSLWIWYTLLDMAIETDDNGLIYVTPDQSYSEKNLAFELGMRSKRVLNPTLTTLEKLGMVELDGGFIKLTSFNERNYRSDDSAARMRNYRRNKKSEDGLNAESVMQPCVTVTNLNQSKTEQIKKDHINPPIVPLGGAVDAGKKSNPVPWDGIADSWNKNAPKELPRVTFPFRESRKKKLRPRWEEKPDMKYWIRLFKDLAHSPFHLGHNDTKWKADIEYVFREHVKLTERFAADRPVILAPDPNCEKCKGRGLYEIIKNGLTYMTPCKCRRPIENPDD